MRMPKRLAPLLEYGVIDRVVRSLLSGKEAQVYLVESGGELRAAKVYKDQAERSFKNRSQYTEGRSVRNSRDRRAMAKRSRHGREQAEANWITTEADAIYKLDAAGVRVPKPHAFIDGVLVMECVTGTDGGPAPRLADCAVSGERADLLFDQILREIIKMLCADTVHGDLSVYNVLVEPAGAVIIDFPQVVDAASNAHARDILLRDVANITSHFRRGTPAERLRYGHEMWDLYDKGELRPDTVLTGMFALPNHIVDADNLVNEMRQIEEDEVLARQSIELDFEGAMSGDEPDFQDDAPEVVVRAKPSTLRRVAPGTVKKEAEKKPERQKSRRRRRRGGRGRNKAKAGAKAAETASATTDPKPADAGTTNKPKKSRRRRRGRRRGRGKGKSDNKPTTTG